MTSKRSLSYQPLQSVFTHLNAGIRIELHRTCESLRCIDKIIPLKIGHLQLEPFSITIDDSSYTIGAKKCLSDPNKINQEEFSLFGQAESRATNIKVSTGDICITDPTPGLKTLVCSHRLSLTMDRNLLLERESKADSVNCQVYIENLKAELLSYDLLPVGNEHFVYRIELIVKRSEQIRKESVIYKKTFSAALKYLMKKIFMGRSDVVQVRNLTIKPEGIICFFRIPLGLKLRVQEITIPRSDINNFNSFDRIIDESSFPLKQIGDLTPPFNQLPHHKKIMTAEKLVIHKSVKSLERDLFTHSRVHYEYVRWPQYTFEDLKKEWISRPPKMGTHVSFNLNDDERGAELMKSLESHRESFSKVMRSASLQNCVVFPIADEAVLAIFCNSGVTDGERRIKYPTIHFRVQERGN